MLAEELLGAWVVVLAFAQTVFPVGELRMHCLADAEFLEADLGSHIAFASILHPALLIR